MYTEAVKQTLKDDVVQKLSGIIHDPLNNKLHDDAHTSGYGKGP